MPRGASRGTAIKSSWCKAGSRSLAAALPIPLLIETQSSRISLPEFSSSRSIDSNAHLGLQFQGGPDASRRRSQRVILSLPCHRSHRRRSKRRLLRRRNAYPCCERARGAHPPGRQSDKRSKASTDEPRHPGGASVPGGECGSESGGKAQIGVEFLEPFPGFLAHFFPAGRLGRARTVIRHLR